MTRSLHLQPPRAFTLVEMLVVVTIVALLLAVSGLGIGNSIRSMELNAAAKNLQATLNHAALLARKENRPIQVRFYKFATPESSASHFRAYQLATLQGVKSDGNADMRLLSEIHPFPPGIVVAPGAPHNTLASLTTVSPASGDVNFGTAYTFASYEVRPDGLTTLPKPGPGVITLVQETTIPSTGDLPANYRSVVINPFNARAKMY